MKTKIPLLVLLGLSIPIAFAQTQGSNVAQDPMQQPAPVLAPSAESKPVEPGTSGSSEMSESEAASPDESSGESAEDPIAALPPAGPVKTLAAKTENGITYLCGGVGKEEAAYMKQAARGHDLMLTFATRRGDYLADVNVTIEDARGETVLQTTCDAPIMLVDMPKSGTYRIHAEAAGYAQDRTARVNTRKPALAALVMTWPQSVSEAGATTSGATSTGGSGQEREPAAQEEEEEMPESRDRSGMQSQPDAAMPRQ